MKLALVIDDYLPHSTRVGAKMFHELALELISQGHQVVVITPQPRQSARLVKEDFDTVEVWRFRSGEIKDVPKVKRAVNETLLSAAAWGVIKSEVEQSTFDGVIYYSPSIFWGHLVSKIKSRCKCKAYLILRDFFPQWAIDGGMISQGSLIERYFRFFESYSYQQADVIGVMSENNLALFNDMTKAKYNTQILRNWANCEPPRLKVEVSFREKLGLVGKTIFFYGGNIGHAQDMANLMRLAKSMQPFPEAHFLFVGQGDEVDLINSLAIEWKLDNFSYLPSVDQQTFKALLKEIDVGLFSLAANHTAHNFPGKLLGYMVESIPILGSVNKGNDLADVINNHGAGSIFLNGDDDALFDAAKNLLMDKQLRRQNGARAYQLLVDHFSVQSAASQIVEHISHSPQPSKTDTAVILR
ncbi:glycosyltransferase family 4 protein [Grimontia hollisae]|uniref:Putative glycosyl transferase n=1 Tax=Grimontia hollisae TaxID=673 RepID=A0A377HMH8_GRIHO|nr:glycosyltransferase family 4 protein [Grimontia hollisae]STO56912.1 putative glycosyl transferase [Grimontia hollisae]